MKDSIIKVKSKAFSVRIVKWSRFLREEKMEYVISG